MSRLIILLFMFAIAGCVTAVDAALYPYDDMINRTDLGRTLIIVEQNGDFRARDERDSIGGVPVEVDLAASHNVMIGFNDAYLAGYSLEDERFRLFSAPEGSLLYTIPIYYRSNNVLIENVCYYENAIVYELQPGVINFIPRQYQQPHLPRYLQRAMLPDIDMSSARDAISDLPINTMDMAPAELRAVIKYNPNTFDQFMSSNDCSYTDQFEILYEFE